MWKRATISLQGLQAQILGAEIEPKPTGLEEGFSIFC